MSAVIEQLAALSTYRDRDLLDVAMAGVLRDLLRPDGAITVARCVGEPGRQRWLVRARLSPGEAVASADAAWSELDSLPPVGDEPDRARCLHTRSPHVVHRPGATTSHFPLLNDHDVIGVLQIETTQPLGETGQRTVTGILRLYANLQSLLDYSERDSLTGLLNRKTFDDTFLRLAALPLSPDSGQRRPQGSTTFWLGVLDVDHFKRVNDTYGHLIGDEVLLLMARLMRSTFRFQDRLFRFGGEEFVVLMRCANAADAARALERLRSNVERHLFPQAGHITVSVGYTALQPGDTPAAAFERADQAVYYAKQHGRNQLCHHADLVRTGELPDTRRDSDLELF